MSVHISQQKMISPSRREWIVSTSLALGGLAVVSADAQTTAEQSINRSAVAIHQEPVFKASPQRVYEALTSAQQFQKIVLLSEAGKSMNFGDKPVIISNEPGGEFSLFGGYVMGRQLELVPNQRIVQAIRMVSWGPGLYSIARFELTEQGSGTKIIFDHTGFPPDQADHLATGWRVNYWEPLEKSLA
jgi:activator of HSP90 ATPase